MRKLIAIFFTLVLLFCTGGYHLVIGLLQQQADRNLESLLDEDVYNEAALIEVRMPLNMPYQQRYTGYERHYGNVEIDGITYTYVKKKIEGDVVVFQCIPNIPRQQLKNMRFDLTRANADLATDHTHTPGTQIKIKSGPELFSEQQLLFTLPAPADNRSLYTNNAQPLIAGPHRLVPHAPPEC